MKIKRQIPADQMVADIRAGMTNVQLMKKHRLSSSMLEKVFKKLQDAKMITARDLNGRLPLQKEQILDDFVRQEPRCYTIIKLPITDMDNLDADCYVRELTEKGLRVGNLSVSVGEKKNFLIQASEYADVQPFSFEAECRWVKTKTNAERQMAGFEITRISDDDLHQLKEFIQSSTLCE